MTVAFVGSPTTLNGTTQVTVVAAPASGKQRELLRVSADNLDSIDHVFKSRKNKGGVFFNYPDVTIQAGQFGYLPCEGIVLTATDESYEVWLNEAATTQPKVDPSVFEVP